MSRNHDNALTGVSGQCWRGGTAHAQGETVIQCIRVFSTERQELLDLVHATISKLRPPLCKRLFPVRWDVGIFFFFF